MMKKTAAIIAFLLLSMPFLLQAQGNASIHCNFKMAIDDSVIMILSVNYLDEFEPKMVAAVNNQQCDFSFPVARPCAVTLQTGTQSLQLFIEPGDNVTLTVQGDSLLNSTSFTGTGAENNTFLRAFLQKFNADFSNEKLDADILAMDIDAFEIKLFEARKNQLAFFNSAISSASYNTAFKNYLSNCIRYRYDAAILAYPIVRANQSQQILFVNALPDIMLEGMDASLVNDDALNAAPYRDYLYYNTVYFTSKANGFNKFKDMNLSVEQKVQTAIQNFSGQSLSWSIANLLNNDLAKLSQYTAQHVFSTLQLKDKEGVYTTLLKKKLDEKMATKEVAATSGDAKSNTPSVRKKDTSNDSGTYYPPLKDIDGNSFSINDLKGKVVYVDFWASWCGPCMGEMPYSKKLHAMFDEKQLKQVEFLYISIDGSEDAWKRAAKSLALNGKVVISPGNWSSPIVKFFGISSIPRYMLIDKKGDIVDLNAKRPSSGEMIYNDIVKLLD